MSIRFGDILQHNNPNFPIADITDIKGGLRSIATFSDASLLSEFASGTGGTQIPEKYKTGYSLLLETTTDSIYYLSGISATTSSDWRLIGGGNISGITGSGTTNSIAKWISSTSLGDSLITDNGDTVTINGNLMVIGTTLTVFTENLLVKDPIILLAGSQSGTPTYDAGLFINRGSSDTQAFIWDESETEFKFITTTSGATVSGDVAIGTYSSVRTGVLSVGTGSRADSRFIVSSSGGTVSLVVDEFGYVYNRGRGNISTNTAFGFMTLGRNTTGNRNTAFGASALSINSDGYDNTAIGVNALLLNTGGFDNTAIGVNTLLSNTSGSFNTAIGSESLNSNTTGNQNTAIGSRALSINSDGYKNTAIGVNALLLNTGGFDNTAIGFSSLNSNTTGDFNTAIGSESLFSNTTGDFNTAIGSRALRYNRANNNTAIGCDSLQLNTIGSSNTAIGYNALLRNTTNINTFGTFSPGSGYVPGTYFNQLLTYATGSTAVQYGRLTIVVGAGGTVSSVIPSTSFLGGLNPLGSGFIDTTTRMSALFGGGSGFEIGITSLSTGQNNTAVGHQALVANTTGDDNTALGFNSLYSNLTGYFNTAIGSDSLYSNTTGILNTAIGGDALYSNTTGVSNTALGVNSLYSNTTGSENTALGASALSLNGVGYDNTAVGVNSLYSNISGSFNTAVGVNSLYSNMTSGSNTAIGDHTLYSNTMGNENTALGRQSLYFNTTGSNNVALGVDAGKLTPAFIGVTNSNNSIFIGYDTKPELVNQTNQIVIGHGATGNGSNTVTLGNDSVIKTYLKGNIQLPTVPTTSGGSYSILTRNDVTGEVEKVSPGNIIWYGQSGTVTPNAIHYLSGSGWTLADASTAASAVGVLAIALGSNASDGMLLRGIYKASTTYYDSMTIGGIQFLSTTSGEFSETAPSATTEFVRIIGYCLLPDSGSGGTLYFSPDSTWVELS